MRPLITCCLNGSTPRGAAAWVPYTPDEVAADAVLAVAAGAGELHIHPRDRAGDESLDPEVCARLLLAVRSAAPGVPVGFTSGLWITGGDPERRLALVRSWTVLPDLVSVNLSEAGHEELGQALVAVGVGLEAGIADLPDTDLLLGSAMLAGCRRILVEVEEETDAETAVAAAAEIESRLAASTVVPRLHHGFGPPTWAVIAAALRAGTDVRIGAEDVRILPDGSPAHGNAELVAAAARLRQTLAPRQAPGA